MITPPILPESDTPQVLAIMIRIGPSLLILYSLRDVERRPVLCSFKRIEGGSAYQKNLLRKIRLHPPLVRGLTAQHPCASPSQASSRVLRRFQCPSVLTAGGHDVLGQVPSGCALGVRFWRCSFSTITEPVCSFSARSSILSTSRTNDPLSYYSNSTFRDPKRAT